MTRLARAGACALLATSLAGCAAPRIITNISITDDNARMIYAQADSSRTGVIECVKQPDGRLVNCREIPVTFLE